jgi:hypothetical protein
MSKGFLIFARNTPGVNYVTQAYALALSIKYSQSKIKNVSIVTNDPIPKKYQKVFDQIIPIPWFTETPASTYAGEHRWKLYHASPYDETIVLDSDMLLLEDITSWWEYCENYNLKYCSKILNYKLESVVDTFHRKAFIANKLTSPYNALYYFKKSDQAHEFFKVLEFVCNNWEWCYNKFAPEYYQNCLSMDLASAIAIEISSMHDSSVDVCSPLEFVHMKTPNQGWEQVPASWQDAVPFVLNSKGNLIVGNIKQSKLFHYVEKNFITRKILNRLEELANGT